LPAPNRHNGTEFASNAILAWQEERGIEWALHRAGQTDAEWLHRELQWQARGCSAVSPRSASSAAAIAMFTGLRKGDVLAITKNAIRDGRIWRGTNKNAQEVSLPLHPDLERLLAAAPAHAAITIAATTRGTTWTESGFNSSFVKAIAKLEREGKVEPGLTFHGLRHTVGTLLIEAGFDLDTVRRWLGHKTLAMAIHYSKSADTSEKMREVNERFDPLGSKKGTKIV
jgi:integrase